MRKGVISDINVKDREQRFPVYIIAMASAVLLLLTMHFLSAPKALVSLLISFFVVGIFSYFVNKKIKISIHTASIAGAAVALFVVVGATTGFVGLISTVITMWARVKIKAHTPQEVAMGFLAGILITLAVFRLCSPL
ncbi:MAG: hypothetical protein WC243_01095 [Patescibacteria group bacterium]